LRLLPIQQPSGVREILVDLVDIPVTHPAARLMVGMADQTAMLLAILVSPQDLGMEATRAAPVTEEARVAARVEDTASDPPIEVSVVTAVAMEELHLADMVARILVAEELPVTLSAILANPQTPGTEATRVAVPATVAARAEDTASDRPIEVSVVTMEAVTMARMEATEAAMVVRLLVAPATVAAIVMEVAKVEAQAEDTARDQPEVLAMVAVTMARTEEAVATEAKETALMVGMCLVT